MTALALALLTALLTVLLFHLRGLSPPSADSTEISRFVERPRWIWYLRWPLTHLLAQALHRGLGWSGADCLALLSSLAGALFMVTVAGVARRSPLLVIALVSSVTLTLAGHVEVYAWPSLALLWLLLLGPLHLRGRVSLTPIVSLFALGCLMHMLLVFYAPALVWLGVVGRRRALARGEDPEPDLRRALLRLLLFLALISAMPFALPPGGLDNDLERLVPLTWPVQPRMIQVTLLSPEHLGQIAVFLGLSCPLGLVLALIRICRVWSSDALRFTSVAALCGLAFLVLWHPDMGWRGDWDLFAHPGLAVNVLAWRLWTSRPDTRAMEDRACHSEPQM